MAPRPPRATPKFRLERPTQRARDLRKQMTPQEKRLWSHLRKSQLGGLVFTRQFPIAGYFGDLACRSARLIVEIDSSQHGEMLAADAERTRRIEAEGYRVLRFWNNDITGNMEGVLQTILETALSRMDRGPTPPPPPASVRGSAEGATSTSPHARGGGMRGGLPLSAGDNGEEPPCP